MQTRREVKGQMALFTGQRAMMIASIRYLDEFARQDGPWLFAECRLMVNWTEIRPIAP